eukprot:Stramenopile-MAST_4_protein_4368
MRVLQLATLGNIFHMIKRIFMMADENYGTELGDLGSNEYLLNISVTDGIASQSILVSLVLQELNFPPTFLNCWTPRGVMESTIDIPDEHVATPYLSVIEVLQGDTAPDLVRFRMVEQTNGDNFQLQPNWPSFASCTPCGDAGTTAMCCSASLYSKVSRLNFELLQTFTVYIATEDDGPGSELNMCKLIVYVNDRNERPEKPFLVDESGIAISELSPLFYQVNVVMANDPEDSLHSIDLFPVSQTVSANSKQLVENVFDVTYAWSNNGEPQFLLRLIYVLNFETVSSYSLNILARDTAGLMSENAVATVAILNANDQPWAVSSGSTVFQVNENSVGGTMVGKLAKNSEFFDEDTSNDFTFALFQSALGTLTSPASSCWSQSIHETSTSKSMIESGSAGSFTVTFNVTSTGETILSFSFSAKNRGSQGGTPRHTMFEIHVGYGKKHDAVRLTAKKTNFQCCGSPSNQQDSHVAFVSAFDSAPLISGTEESSMWVRVQTPHPNIASSSSPLKMSFGEAIEEFSPKMAFDGSFATFFLSHESDTELPLWVENDFLSEQSISKVQIFGSNGDRFPRSWIFRGSLEGNVWTDILNVSEEKLKSPCALKQGQCNSVGLSEPHVLNPASSYRFYRFVVTAVFGGGAVVQINELVFYDEHNQIIPLSTSTGKVSMGYNGVYKKVLFSSDLDGAASVDGFHARTSLGESGKLRNLCINGPSLYQGTKKLYESDLFEVNGDSGDLFVANGIFGGPHGTLDFERIPRFGLIVSVTDNQGESTTVDIIIVLVDINEPPILHKSCSKSFTHAACLEVSESIKADHSVGLAGNTVASDFVLRVYGTEEALVLGSSQSASSTEAVDFSSDLVEGAQWLVQGQGKMVGIQFEYTNGGNLNGYLHLLLDGMNIATYDMSTFSDEGKTNKKHILLDIKIVNITIARGSSGGPSIVRLKIFQNQVGRMYSADEATISGALLTVDNMFSPKFFTHFIGYGTCSGDLWWHWLEEGSSNAVSPCYEQCVTNEDCNYFWFNSQSSICRTYSSCTVINIENNSFPMLFNRRGTMSPNNAAAFGNRISIPNAGASVYWYIQAEEITASHTILARLRYNSYGSGNASARLLVNGDEIHSFSLPSTDKWSLSGSFSANLVYGKKNSLLIIVDRLSFPDTVLHLDFLELFDEAKVSDGYFRGYDLDDGDMVKATLLNGHLYDNVKQFELSSSSWVSGGANIIYNDGDEEFGYTFTTKYIFLGKGKRFWCQPGKFPCNHWSIISLSALESPTSVSVNAYRFGNQPGTYSEVCDVMELGIAQGSKFPLPNIIRVEAWVKVSAGWDGNNSHLLQLQLFDANGDSFTSVAGLMKFGLPLKRDVWSLEYYEVNVGGANINDAILHVG